jgi:hypothetical protein
MNFIFVINHLPGITENNFTYTPEFKKKKRKEKKMLVIPIDSTEFAVQSYM